MTYQICSKCVMDTSDPDITFDSMGVCNHCIEFETITKKGWFPNEEGTRLLAATIERIKQEGCGQEYDCIIGLSGGVDSSYLALKAKDWGLRPLVMHVDAGWNSELAVANIEKIVKYCGYDLHTLVMDWEDMRDLHLSYLKAGIANQDVPQDHAFFSGLYHFATKNNVRYVLSGGNLATEGIFPKAWHGSAMDAINLHAIHDKFGERKLKFYKTIGFFDYYLRYPFVNKMRTVRPLNFMPYDKKSAIGELVSTIGWTSYGRKHGESLFTKFFQNYYLPTKFGYDKRRPHLSSLIVSGQLSREEAFAQLEIPLYLPDELEIDTEFFCKKLRLTKDQLESFMSVPSHHYTDFSNWDNRYRLLKVVQGFVQKIIGKKLVVYS